MIRAKSKLYFLKLTIFLTHKFYDKSNILKALGDLNPYMDTNNSIHNSQYGFLNFKSYLDQLIDHYDYILTQLQQIELVDLIYLNLGLNIFVYLVMKYNCITKIVYTYQYLYMLVTCKPLLSILI